MCWEHFKSDQDIFKGVLGLYLRVFEASTKVVLKRFQGSFSEGFKLVPGCYGNFKNVSSVFQRSVMEMSKSVSRKLQGVESFMDASWIF